MDVKLGTAAKSVIMNSKTSSEENTLVGCTLKHDTDSDKRYNLFDLR